MDTLKITFLLSSKIYITEPNRTKSYKLERVLNKNLESIPSAMFPKLWNAIQIGLKETKSQKYLNKK